MKIMPLAILLIASPVLANIPLRWAPVLNETLPQVHKGRAGEIAANMDGLVLEGLAAGHGTLVALSRAGIDDLEGLDELLSAPDAQAQAAALGADARELESLRRSLDILTPTIDRLQARGLKPYSIARSRFIPALSRALEDQSAMTTQAVAAAGRPDPNEMRDAPADHPRPKSALSRRKTAPARAANPLTK